ncbi:DUF3618 domain-containing protein [Nocardioides sp. InS609-2]|uniref:DUF3618 domain-containing protein n=1 Tax=Nocardioides sp. InS609-2 TaxID=2760705 RepID=UPI0020C154BF|nr:DUF3618 domain-containing protein [Nocardioides sp. InS609-2]
MSNDMSSLEREIEAARDSLASTIDQLVHRASPKTIIGRQVYATKAHFVDMESGQPRTDNILKVAGGVLGAVVLVAVLRRITR